MVSYYSPYEPELPTPEAPAPPGSPPIYGGKKTNEIERLYQQDTIIFNNNFHFNSSKAFNNALQEYKNEIYKNERQSSIDL